MVVATVSYTMAHMLIKIMDEAPVSGSGPLRSVQGFSCRIGNKTRILGAPAQSQPAGLVLDAAHAIRKGLP